MKRKKKLASSLVVVNGMPLLLSVREVVTDVSGGAFLWLSTGLVIERLQNLGSTPNAVARRVSLRKTFI